MENHIGEINLSGDYNTSIVGSESVTINHNGMAKEELAAFRGLIDRLLDRNEELMDRLIKQAEQLAEYKCKIAEGEKEIQRLNKLLALV